MLTAPILYPRKLPGSLLSPPSPRIHAENILGPLFVYMSPEFREVPSVWTLAGGSLLLTTLALHEVALWRLRSKRDTQHKRNYSSDAAGDPAHISGISPAEAPAKARPKPQRRFRPVRWRAMRGMAVPAVESNRDSNEGLTPGALNKPPASTTIA
jgi:hypothetical protein